MIPELRDLSYEEQLKDCGLTTLETRRLRGYQIEVFKILNGYEYIDSNIFSQTTVSERDKLSTDCVTASNVNMFKK